jgi:hypothetical protein
MRLLHRIMVALGASISCLSGQPSPPRPIGVQDRTLRRQYEDKIARSFEALRDKGNLTRLKRIAHREALEQLVCTAALNDSPVWRENSPAALMYRTDNPALLTPELERIARYKDLLQGGNNPPNTRYAVAVWPATDRKSGQRVYWVGIQIYVSAWWEFIDNNFTDDRPRKNEWKNLVSGSCRGID